MKNNTIFFDEGEEFYEQSYSYNELNKIRNKKRFKIGDMVSVIDAEKDFWSCSLGHKNAGYGPFEVLDINEIENIGPVGHTQHLTLLLKDRKNVLTKKVVSGHFFSE